MSEPSRDFEAQYAAALVEYLERADESALERAYELGRSAISRGLGVLDLTKIHASALRRARSTERVGSDPADRAWPFFNEALGPFEMALRGFREANDSLKEAASLLEQRVAERTRELSVAEKRYRSMFEDSPVPMWTYDRDTLAFTAVNDAAIQHYGYSRDEFAQLTLADIRPPEEVSTIADHIARACPEEPGQIWRHRKKDGGIIMVEIKAHDLEVDGAQVRLVLAHDVTDRERAQATLRKTEEQLRQAQKMEAIGRLAGGVAHDFNNVLSVILSYSELLLLDIEAGSPMYEDVQEIRKAGKRAAELTRQLLMFSRQQVLEPKVLDLNEVLINMDKMLQRILGADVDLVSLTTKSLGRVRVDPGNMEQVIMNLVVNARDAMPTGGKLTMETANVFLDEEYVGGHLGLSPGPHVMLAVSDTGMGMDKATQARIFEPFFTTKATGKGTGLGLSTVFGIVQQGGGGVWVYSEIGKGTTFKIYLPRVDATTDDTRFTIAPTTLRGSETILLVEDDDQVRAVAGGILRRHGYDVMEGRNAGEALLLCEKHGGRIDLLITDVVMPQMSGPELAKRLTETRPEMKILCMSGYTDDSIVRHGVLKADIAYVQKPLTPDVLTRRVREVLDVSNEEQHGSRAL